jgi:hypothetical protein
MKKNPKKLSAEIIDLAVASSDMHRDPYNILAETNRLMQLAIADRNHLKDMLESLEIEFPTAALAELQKDTKMLILELTEKIEILFTSIDGVRKNAQMAKKTSDLGHELIPK